LIDVPSESEEKDLPQMKLWRDAAAKKSAGKNAASPVTQPAAESAVASPAPERG
jgi:hypothetical protein